MEYTRLGKTELEVSRICLGTWQFGGAWGEVDLGDAVGAVRRALRLGINFFDTAQAYGFGAAEEILSVGLRDELKGSRRDELVLATKGGLRLEGGRLLRDSSPSWLRQGLEQSLRNLRTDHIDLYQVHWPDPDTPMEETAEAMDAFVREGKVRYVGVSNFDVAQMEAFRAVRPLDSLQPPYSLFRRDIEAEVLPYCREHGIAVMVYGALAHGLLGGRWTLETTFEPDDWRSASPIFRGEPFRRNLAVVEALKSFARDRGHTVAELAVAWALANPAVDVAIVGARDAGQIAGTAGAAEFPLTEEELAEIDRLAADAVPTGGPTPEGATPER